jgi:hypothetical protein
LLLSPTNNSLILNNIDFSNVANSISKDTEAFKNIKKHSKLTNSNISNDLLNNNLKYQKINNLYLNNNTINNNSFNYGIYRQHNFTSLNSTLPSYSTLVDKNSLNKFFDYSLSLKNSGSTIKEVTTPYNVSYNLNKESINSSSNYSHSVFNKFYKNLSMNK